MTITQLKVEELAIHLIQRSTKAAPAAAQLSEALTDLNDQNRGFLQDRLRDTLKKARSIVEDPENSSPVPGLIREYLSGTCSLLDASRLLATELQSKQAAVSPSGLLLVARVLIGEGEGLAIAKWEHERGARTELVENAEGKHVYDMQFLQDLFMTDTSKVYKVAMFAAADVGPNRVEGRVVDPQSVGASVAHYFRVGFLGCEYKIRPELQTEQFHDAAQRFIDTVRSPETQAKYQVALMSEMLSNRPDLSVRSFANDYLDLEDRDNFAAQMSRIVPLATTIPKDLTLVRSRLKRVQFEFDSGTTVLAPPDEVGEDKSVQVESEGDVTRLSVTGKVIAMSGRGTVAATDD